MADRVQENLGAEGGGGMQEGGDKIYWQTILINAIKRLFS